MSRLTLDLFGSLQVTLGGEPVTGFKSDKVRALLAFLAVEADRPHRRESLAALLWPDSADSVALANLRGALYNLRHALRDYESVSPYILVRQDTVQFNPASERWLDVEAFAEKAARAAMGDESGLGADPGLVDRLEAAIALYRGEFLEGFSIGDSVLFEEWALIKREQLHRQMLESLRRLAAIFEQRGEYEQAIRYARRRLELESWHEEAHQQLMRLLALSGQRGAALAQYEACRRLLARELRAEPAPETTALYEAIRDARLPGRKGEWGEIKGGEGDSASPYHAPTPSPFVARERELAQLDGYLIKALAGQGRVVFVTGDAGSGKTALIGEFARLAMAMRRDLVVAGGKSSFHTGVGDPYLPFREIMHLLAGDTGPGCAGIGISDEHARRLSAMMPYSAQALVDHGPDLIDLFVPGEGLLTRLRAAGPGDVHVGQWYLSRLEELAEQRRTGTARAHLQQADLFEQFTEVMRSLARRHPLMLVFDDLQWADNASISLLFHLGRRLAGSRILVVGAYRPASVAIGRQGERHPLEPVIHELARDFGERWVDLDQVDGRQFVEALLDTEPNGLGPAFRQRLTRYTGGHALFTVELVHGLQERGDLVRDDADQWVEGPALDWEQLPRRVEAVIAERIGRLSNACRTLLGIASVEGEEFTAEVVARVRGIAEANVIRRLSGTLSKEHRLVSAEGLVRLDGRCLSRYRFRHYLFQKYLYQSLDVVERPRLHEKVGNALEAVYGERASELAAQLARHFEAAGLAGRAVDYLHQAGLRAAQASAHEEALDLLGRGLRLLQALPDTPERARQEMAVQLARLTPLATLHGVDAPDYSAAYTRACELMRQSAGTDVLLEALYGRSGLSQTHGKYQDSLALGEQLLAQPAQAVDWPCLAAAHTLLGFNHVLLGEIGSARGHVECTLAAYNVSDHRFHQPALNSSLGVACLSAAPLMLWALGYPDQALDSSHESLVMARGLGEPRALGLALSLAWTTVAQLCHKHETTLALLGELRRVAADQRLAVLRELADVLEGWCQTEAGQARGGIARMQRSLAAWQGTRSDAGQPQLLMLLAEAHLKGGQAEAGLAVIDEALGMLERTGRRYWEAELYRLKGEMLLQASSRWSMATGQPLLPGNQPSPGGHRATTAGEAQASFRHAIAVARQQQAKSWELRAATSLARLLRAQDEQQEAYQVLAEVYGWFTEGFNTSDLRDARELLARL